MLHGCSMIEWHLNLVLGLPVLQQLQQQLLPRQLLQARQLALTANTGCSLTAGCHHSQLLYADLFCSCCVCCRCAYALGAQDMLHELCNHVHKELQGRGTAGVSGLGAADNEGECLKSSGNSKMGHGELLPQGVR